MIETRTIACPYCGEHFETSIDPSAGSQCYIEDCCICCRPIEFDLKMDANGTDATLTLKRDDE